MTAPWGERRKRIIELVLGSAAIVLIGVVIAVSMYRAPSCIDKRQNQGEQGIDCGGPCLNACNANEAEPKVVFVRALRPDRYRTDVIAYVSNTNSDAGVEHAKATIQLYDRSNALITQGTVFITLPPSTTVPVFATGLYEGNRVAVRAFMTIDPTSLTWSRSMQRPITPTPTNITTLNNTTPKIAATLTNPSAQEVDNLTVVATVFDPSGNAIAASQTVVRALLGQGSADLIFTWNTPFTGIPARIEILPVPKP